MKKKSQHGLNIWNYIKHAFRLRFFSITELYLDISILKTSRLAARKMFSLHLCCRRHKRGYVSMTSCNVPLIYSNRINFFQAYIWKSLWIQQLFLVLCAYWFEGTSKRGKQHWALSCTLSILLYCPVWACVCFGIIKLKFIVTDIT